MKLKDLFKTNDKITLADPGVIETYKQLQALTDAPAMEPVVRNACRLLTHLVSLKKPESSFFFRQADGSESPFELSGKQISAEAPRTGEVMKLRLPPDSTRRLQEARGVLKVSNLESVVASAADVYLTHIREFESGSRFFFRAPNRPDEMIDIFGDETASNDVAKKRTAKP